MADRPLYSDYASNYFKRYANWQGKNQLPRFRDSVDELNYLVCQRAFMIFDASDREILLQVYESQDTLADSVYQTSIRHSIPQGEIWIKIRKLEAEFARIRGI